eukprot:2934684-Pleurochrysis_carterae.AAC.1
MLAPIDDTGRVRWQVFLEQYEWCAAAAKPLNPALVVHRPQPALRFFSQLPSPPRATLSSLPSSSFSLAAETSPSCSRSLLLSFHPAIQANEERVCACGGAARVPREARHPVRAAPGEALAPCS